MKTRKAQTNFNDKLPQPQDELAQEILKDPYNFDFLTLRKPYNEHMLEEALEHNIRRFLLELGTGLHTLEVRWNFACLVEPATFRIWYSIIQS